MDELNKIDELRHRFNISYKEAADLLKETNGDLLAALIKMEEKTRSGAEQAFDKGPEMWDKVKDTVKEQSKKNIVITKDGKTVAQVPVAVGALGVLGAIMSTPVALIAGVGTVTALAKNYSFKLSEKENESKTTTEDSYENTNFHQDEWAEPAETIIVEPEQPKEDRSSL